MEQNYLFRARAEKKEQLKRHDQLEEEIRDAEVMLEEKKNEMLELGNLEQVRSDLEYIQECIYELGLETRPPENEETTEPETPNEYV